MDNLFGACHPARSIVRGDPTSARMLLGINAISPSSLTAVRDLIQRGQADFCELMVDNVAHLPPAVIRETLQDVPVALHIVRSRFLELPLEALQTLADYLRPWIHALQPLYVSDHLLRFTDDAGRALPMIAEPDYAQGYDHLCHRVMCWQRWLDVPLLIENHASVTARGKHQAIFFSRLMADTGAGLLFDFSNAYIAQYNQIAPMTDWDAFIPTAQHVHVGGFRIDPVSQLAIDTHDQPIDNNVLDSMRAYLKKSVPRTMVIEFDASVSAVQWQAEVMRCSALLQEAAG